MDALLFALTFEVVLLQMKILEGSSALRLQGWRPTSKLERLQYMKVVSDRALVNNVIRKILMEVIDNGKWNTISKTLNHLKQKNYEVRALKCSNEELKASRTSILQQLKLQRNQWKTDLRDADSKVALLRDKMSDDLSNATARLCYAEKWLFARFESLELEQNKPRPPKPCIEHEERAHSELLRVYDLEIKERTESLRHWRDRYARDTTEISTRVLKKGEDLKVTIAKRTELQKLYDLHEGEMRGWLTFKRERSARLAREEHQRLSAQRIQAWWRGVMVRRALGQFKNLRLNKKPPGKGKKK